VNARSIDSLLPRHVVFSFSCLIVLRMPLVRESRRDSLLAPRIGGGSCGKRTYRSRKNLDPPSIPDTPYCKYPLTSHNNNSSMNSFQIKFRYIQSRYINRRLTSLSRIGRVDPPTVTSIRRLLLAINAHSRTTLDPSSASSASRERIVDPRALAKRTSPRGDDRATTLGHQVHRRHRDSKRT